MADNIRLDLNTTQGSLVRSIEKNSKQVPVSLIDVGGASEAILGNAGVYMPIEGGAADGSTANIGNPVIVGAKYDITPDALGDGEVGHLASDSNRRLKTVIYDAAGNDRGLNVDADGAVAVTFSNSTINYDTTIGETANASCFGVVVPSESGPAAVTGTAGDGSSIGLDVNILNADEISSGGGGTEYVNASTGNTFTGGVLIAEDDAVAGTARVLKCSASGSLNVDVGTPTVGISNSSNTIKIDSSGNTVGLDTGANTVKIDSSSNTVAISSSNNTVKIASTNNLVGLDTSANTVKIASTNNTVSIAANSPVSLQTSGTDLTSTAVGADQCLDVYVQGGVSGTEYTEDEANGTTSPSGGTAILVRADGSLGALPNTVVSANGDYIANRGTKYGSSYVTTVSSDGKIGVLQGWDYETNGAAQNIKVDSSGSVHVLATGTTSVSGTVQANSQGKFYDRTYGSSNAGSSPSVAQVDVNSYGQITLDTSYEVGRTGALDNLGIAESEPRVSLSGAIIDSQLEDLTNASGLNHADGDAVQLRVNNNGRLYVDVGSPTVDLGATDSTHLSNILTSTQLIDDAVAAVDAATSANKVMLSGAKVHKSSPLVDLRGKSDGDASGLYVNDRGALFSTLAPNAQAGLLNHRSIDISTTYKLVANARCSLYSLSAFNMTNSALYLKIYNDPSPGAGDTPVFTFPIPANASSTGAGFMWNSAIGVLFGVGMGYRVTTGLADNDITYPSAGDVIINIGYAL